MTTGDYPNGGNVALADALDELEAGIAALPFMDGRIAWAADYIRTLEARVNVLEGALRELARADHTWNGRDCGVVHMIAAEALSS